MHAGIWTVPTSSWPSHRSSPLQQIASRVPVRVRSVARWSSGRKVVCVMRGQVDGMIVGFGLSVKPVITTTRITRIIRGGARKAITHWSGGNERQRGRQRGKAKGWLAFPIACTHSSVSLVRGRLTGTSSSSKKTCISKTSSATYLARWCVCPCTHDPALRMHELTACPSQRNATPRHGRSTHTSAARQIDVG